MCTSLGRCNAENCNYPRKWVLIQFAYVELVLLQRDNKKKKDEWLQNLIDIAFP